MIPVVLLATLLAAPTADHTRSVNRGLAYLAGKQSKDGYWDAGNGSFRVTTTAYAGLALLMEGSTLGEGPYAGNLLRAVAWFEKIAQPNGALVPANDPGEAGRSIQSQAPALLFLATVYDLETDGPRRRRLEKLLTAAVRFAAEGQTTRGGWGLIPARDGNGYEESYSTAPMLHALVTADRAGVAVPPDVLAKATRNLQVATNREGGIIFGTANGPIPGARGEVLPTASAAATFLAAARRPAELARWVAFSYASRPPLPRPNAPGAPPRPDSNWLQQYLAVARVANALGDTGHAVLAPGAPDTALLRWSPLREHLFFHLTKTQLPDGNWADQYIGTNYSTALALIILQLDNNYLPAFSR